MTVEVSNQSNSASADKPSETNDDTKYADPGDDPEYVSYYAEHDRRKALARKGQYDELLEASEDELKAMSDTKMAMAIRISCLLLEGHPAKARDLYDQAPDDDIKGYIALLLQGKYPAKAEEFLQYSPDELQIFFSELPYLLTGITVAKLWLSGSEKEAVEACDGMDSFFAAIRILNEHNQPEAKHFNEAMAVKEKPWLVDTAQVAALWLAGGFELAYDLCKTPEFVNSTAEILKTKDLKQYNSFVEIMKKKPMG